MYNNNIQGKKTSLIPNHLKLNDSINYKQIKKYVDGFQKLTVGDQANKNIQEPLPLIRDGNIYESGMQEQTQTIG